MATLTLNPLARLYVLLCIPYVWLVGKFWFVCEDAFITFRYSRNLAEGLGARYNLGEHIPVEGYSNFLWMLLAAGFELVGMDVVFWLPLISAACGLTLLWLLIHTLHERLEMSILVTGLSGAVFAFFVPVTVWTTSGLATMPQSLLMFASYVWLAYGKERKEWLLGSLFALTLAWLRTEGVEWAVVIVACATVSRLLRGEDFKRPLALCLGVLLIGYGAYFSWRYSYYQSLLSNTAHAKVELSSESVARGIQYVSYYAVLMLSPLLLPFAAGVASFGKRRAHGLGFATMAVAVPTYALVISGDYMAFFRMMVPGVAFMAVSFGFFYDALLRRFDGQLPLIASAGSAIALLGVLPGYDIILVPTRIINAVQTRLIASESLEKDLAEQGIEIADRSQHLFGFGESFTIRRGRNELKRWERMENNPVRWKADAAALMQVVRPTDRLVSGAIGALGYFTNLYIFDQHGLIDGDVTKRRDRSQLRWPGHDKFVKKGFFLNKNPEILEYQVLSGKDAALKVAVAGYEFDRPAPREWYFPEVSQVQVEGLDDPVYVVLQRRSESTHEAYLGWQRFHAEFGDELAYLFRKSNRGRGGPAYVVHPLGGRWQTFTKDSNLEEPLLDELLRLESTSALGEASEDFVAGAGGLTRVQQEEGANGHLLYTSTHSPMALLTDGNGDVIHRWSVRFNQLWNDFPIEKEFSGRHYWRATHLLPDGELLGIMDGLGMFKLDKNSKVLWKHVNRAHHGFDLGPEGRIHVLTRLIRPRRVDAEQVPVIEDFVTVMTTEGVKTASVSVLDALEEALSEELEDSERPPDLMVANAVQVLTDTLAAQLPGAEQGDVLVSLPKLSLVVVLNLASEQVVWRGRGDFELQQDVSLLANGNLLLLDGRKGPGARVVEVDSRTMETVWSTVIRSDLAAAAFGAGTVDRLPSGETLVVDTARGYAVALSPAGETVWEFVNPHPVGEEGELVAQLPQASLIEAVPLDWLAEVKVASEQDKAPGGSRASSGRKSKKRKR
jgi:arabinofuranosyltransferase